MKMAKPVGNKYLSVGSKCTSSWEDETHLYNRMHYRLALVLKEIRHINPTRILELGCGIGVLRAELLKCYSNTNSYFGTDISESAVSTMNEPNVVCADLNREFPFTGMTFDCIVGSGIMEYVKDIQGFLREVNNRLPVDGYFIVSYFNMTHIWRRLKSLLGTVPYRHSEWQNDLSYQRLRELFFSSGFHICHERPVSAGIFAAPGVYRKSSLSLIRKSFMEALPDLLIHTKVFVLRKV